MINVDGPVMVDNLQYDEALVSRVQNLRKVLRELREALRDERQNLHQEIEMTILQKFIELQRNYQTLSEHARYSSFWRQSGGVQYPRIPRKAYQGTPYSNGDTSKTQNLVCLGSAMYQRVVDELQEELDSFEHRLSVATSSSYRRKIYDLEAICHADLNRVRSRFVRSLQAFENTIESIEELCPWKAKPPPSCRCSAKKPPAESSATAFRFERPPSRNVKYDRSLVRCKSIIADDDQWSKDTCVKRYSDSEMCSKIYRSSKYAEDSDTTSVYNSEANLRANKSISTIFPAPVEVSYIPI